MTSSQRVRNPQNVTLSPQVRQQIEAALPDSRRRTFKLDCDGRAIWIKQPRRGPGYTMYGLQSFTAALVGIPALRPPRVSRFAAGLRAEARRLARLQRSGWPVPQVLDVNDRWLALSDNGLSLVHGLSKLPVRRRVEVLRPALAYLQSLHAQGRWHGAAQVRNFTERTDGLGLVDFEDDLEPVMPLATRQARDILLFVMSAARFAADDHRVPQALLAEARQRMDPAVEAEIAVAAEKLVRARKYLGPIARVSGRDGRGLDLIARACESTEPPLPDERPPGPTDARQHPPAAARVPVPEA